MEHKIDSFFCTRPKTTRRFITRRKCLTVRFLVSRAGTGTAELLGFLASRIGNQKGSIVRDEQILDFLFRLFVHVLLVISDNGAGDSLAYRVNLRNATSTAHTHANVNAGEALFADDENRLLKFVLERFWFNLFEGLSVDLDQSLSRSAVGDGSGRHFYIRILLDNRNRTQKWDESPC